MKKKLNETERYILKIEMFLMKLAIEMPGETPKRILRGVKKSYAKRLSTANNLEEVVCCVAAAGVLIAIELRKQRLQQALSECP